MATRKGKERVRQAREFWSRPTERCPHCAFIVELRRQVAALTARIEQCERNIKTLEARPRELPRLGPGPQRDPTPEERQRVVDRLLEGVPQPKPKRAARRKSR